MAYLRWPTSIVQRAGLGIPGLSSPTRKGIRFRPRDVLGPKSRTIPESTTGGGSLRRPSLLPATWLLPHHHLLRRVEGDFLAFLHDGLVALRLEHGAGRGRATRQAADQRTLAAADRLADQG